MTINNSGDVRKYDSLPAGTKNITAQELGDLLDNDVFEDDLPVKRIYSRAAYQRYNFAKKK